MTVMVTMMMSVGDCGNDDDDCVGGGDDVDSEDDPVPGQHSPQHRQQEGEA